MKHGLGAILMAGTLMAVPLASQAALLDNFNSYAVGNASSANPPWVTTVGGGTNFVADILDNGNGGAGDHYISIYAGGDYRNMSRTLSEQFTGEMTFEFDVLINEDTGVNTAIGLCSSLNTAGPAIDWYEDYGPYVRITPDNFAADGKVGLDVRSGGVFVDDIASLNIGQWYTVRLEINTSTKLFDVYVDDTSVYNNAAFRLAINECDTVLLMAGFDAQNATLTAEQYNVGIDNINFTGVGVPFSIVSTSPTGGGVTNQPTLQAVIVNGSDTINTSSITLSLNGSVVPHTISQSLPTTTVSYAVSPPLDQMTTYTGRVVVAGTQSGLVLTNTWTFTTEAVGKYIPTGYTLYDNFESYPDSGGSFNQGVTTAGKWLLVSGNTVPANGTVTNTCDIFESAPGGDTYARLGTSGALQFGLISDVPDIEEGSSGGVFFRINSTDTTPDTMYGLTAHSPTNTAGWDYPIYEVQLGLVGTDLRARNGATTTNLLTGVPPNTWVNIRIDVHNNAGATNDTYDVYTSYGTATPTLAASGLGFRNGTSNSLTTFFTRSNTAQAVRTAGLDDVYFLGSGPTIMPDIQSIGIASGTATLVWTSESGVTYTILSKTALTDATWATKKSGIASAGDGTTSDSVPAAAAQEFFKIEGN